MRLKFYLTLLVFVCLSSVFAQTLDPSTIKNLKIRNVGPANMSGRITAIDAVTSDPKTIYVGAASGGVWKSENGGSAWEPVFDAQPTQNIGAIAIQQSNPDVIWVGTGEGNPRNSMNLGMGIFKSIDAGKTWQHMGLAATKTIHRIKIHPNDPNTVFVGAMGDPFTPNEDRGLYKSTDGGLSWKRILYSNNQSGIADLVMDPSNPNKMFAALYEHRRTPYYFTSGGNGSGLYSTHDAGETWKQLDVTNGLPEGELGRIGLAIAQSDPQRMYAKIEATINALYRSDNGGTSWYLVNDDPKFTNNRPFYFQELGVDTKDPNRLYNLYQPLHVSYDGGKTFDPTPMIPADETKGIHADFHAFWVNPNDPENFIIGGDGGIGITNDHGKSWYFPETIPVAQFYHINVDNDRPYNVYGGMQDNGNWSGPGYTWKRGGIRTLYWQYLVGGDGFYVSPDLENSRVGYGTSQNGNLYRYDKLTGYYVSIIPPAPDLKTNLRFNWNAAFAQDPFNTHKAYYGSQFVHITEDKGATWSIISPDLSTNNPAHQKGDYGGLTLDLSGAEMYNSILSIAPSPLNKEVVWVGTDDGQVQLTMNAGKTWRNLTKNVKGLPKEAWIAQIKASSYQEGTAWMVVNNYRKGDYEPYLFKTTNFGKTWLRVVDAAKVKGYALAVIQDPVAPNLVFLGTENGLWMSVDEGANWQQFKNGFPSVSTMDLAIQETESALIVGTFGRAIWVLDDLLSLREIASKKLKQELTAFPVNDAVQVKGLFINPPGNIWTGFHTTFEGENRAFKETPIPFYLNTIPDSTSTVTASVYNDQGVLIRTLKKNNLTKGLNYLSWRLDEQSSATVGTRRGRAIAVHPGNYKIALNYKNFKDTTSVKVISDPRFELDPEIDLALYNLKKAADVQAKKLNESYAKLDKSAKIIKNIEKQLERLKYKKEDPLMMAVKTINETLERLYAKGQTPRPKRQVGAWSTLEVSPASKLREVFKASAAKTSLPTSRDFNLLKEATQLIETFSAEVSNFEATDWKQFETLIKNSNLTWFNE
tara:strand:+ start:100060 stop:103173 length:3114 start_codon:yes stop_codon:yes gene_type:complete